MQLKTIQQYLFLGLLASISVLFLWMIGNFISAVFWAIILGILFYPLKNKLLGIFPRFPSLVVVITMISAFIIVFVPIFFISSIAVKESVGFYHSFVRSSSSTKEINIINRLVEASSFLENFGVNKNQVESTLVEGAKNATAWIYSQLIDFGQNTFSFLLKTLVMLYLFFFILKDGEKLKKKIIDVSLLGNNREDQLIKKFGSTAKAIIKGVFIIAIIQGILTGTLIWIVGISAPFLWGILTMLLSIIPAVGPILIWLPIGISLLITGNIWQGLVILLGGIFLINMVDYVLRPILVGKDTKMPSVMVLLSTLGGLSLFGLSGFIIGPIIAALFLTIWHIFATEHGQGVSDNSK